MRTLHSIVAVLAGVTATTLAGCGGDGGEITSSTGSLEIRTTTTGEPLGDYSIGVDDGAPAPIGANATIALADVEAGPHVVELGGLPTGCTVTGENPRTVNVTAGAGTTAEFSITCIRPVGTIQVTTATTGPAPASYELLVDATNQGPLAPSAVRSLFDVPVGAHTAGLAGIPANCQVAGENPQSVTVQPAATTAISFAVSCTEPPVETGALTITTTTTGSDPDGFRVVTDGGAAQPIALTGSLTLPSVGVGSHTVRLTGLAANCSVTGPNPQRVTVAAGATATVAFAIQCSPTQGSLRIVVSTSGSNPDPDGYTFAIDNGAPQAIAPAASITVAELAPGSHTVALAGLAGNCTVPNPSQMATVTGGGTVEVAFTVTCSASTLQWTRMQSGTTYSLIDVWGSDPANVLVVGERGGGFHGGIFHYNGTTWSQTYSEDGPVLESVWGTGPTSAFAVGSDPLAAFSTDGILLRFDGSTWSRMTGPGVGTTDGSRQVSFHGVWGTSETNVYAVGIVFDQISHALVARYDGARWTAIPLSADDDRVLEDVHGTSASDVFAVGFLDRSQSLQRGQLTSSLRTRRRQGSLGLILHYDGTNWTEFAAVEPESYFNGVWSNAPNDVFAVGGRGVSGIIYHYDGITWSAMTVPPTGELFEVWGAAANDVYAVGAGVILHYDGSAWTVVQAVPERLTGVWGRTASDVFAVGSVGAIYHGPPTPTTVRR